MIKITMPQAGQTMEEGTIVNWRKSEGEQVRKGEILFEIETDKANVEVEATEDGILRKILCPAGVTVPVLAPIGILSKTSEDISALAEDARGELRSLLSGNPALIEELGLGDAGAGPTKVAAGVREAPVPQASHPSAAAHSSAQGIKASPAARKIARERNLDLGGLMPGSGPGGRLLSTDVGEVPAGIPGGVVRRPMTGMRRAIARNLLLSKQTIPHFYMRLTIDAAPLLDFYRSEKSKYACTLNDVIMLACARAMRDFPALRSRIEGDDLVESRSTGIGLAVGMEDGLRVPVLDGIEQMTLRQVAEESRRIIEAAQQGKLEGVGKGVFTISNLGMYGIEEFAAIINPPEAAILAVGAIREDVLVRDGAFRAGRVMTMTLSADHRVVDGLLAAKFLAHLKSLLEAPEALAS